MCALFFISWKKQPCLNWKKNNQGLCYCVFVCREQTRWTMKIIEHLGKLNCNENRKQQFRWAFSYERNSSDSKAAEQKKQCKYPMT